jgi:glycosyltransferase involved in cell wall biosynthesis
VVPSWGAPATLPALLRALGEQTLPPEEFEILVVDTGSDGGWRRLAELAEHWRGAARLRIVAGPLGGGPGARRNRGATLASGRVLAFTDTDCCPEPSWLAAGIAAVGGGLEVVQGRTLPPAGVAPGPLDHHIVVEGENGLYETCNMFYERELFERLGGFSSHYFRHMLVPFGEDAELAWRARRSGARVGYEATAVVRHAVVPRSARGYLSYQWGARGFPMLVRDVPELRRSLMYRRLFLSARSARFCAAIAGLALARRAPAAAGLAVPYAAGVLREVSDTRSGPGERARHAALRVVGDAALAAGLVAGSARWKTPVL